ncbi:ankyrin repeat-containing domain protein [Cladorrhinum sp. PSN332]|nr:ankyrin repeat-containing domain protein [Cladorrhinum sp. PSN332]
MRFGRDLHKHMVPAWADSYLNYRRLKGAVKEWWWDTDDLQDRYGASLPKPDTDFPDFGRFARVSLEAMLALAAESRTALVDTNSFRQVNIDGFARIASKRQKLEAHWRLEPQCQFAAGGAELWDSLATVNWFYTLVARAVEERKRELPLTAPFNPAATSGADIFRHLTAACHGDFQDALGRFPLHYAALLGLTEECRNSLASMKLAGWSRVTPLDKFRESPIGLAVRLGHAAVTRVLLEDSNADTSDYEMGCLLFTAIQSESRDVLSVLLSACSGQVSYKNHAGETALYVAARQGQVDMVRALLLAGADPNQAERIQRRTPLMVATIQGHQDVVQALVLDPNVDRDLRDSPRGRTAFDHAAHKGYVALMPMLQHPA